MRSRLRWFLPSLLLLGVLLWHASQPRPLGPAEGTSLEGEVVRPRSRARAEPPRQTLRIGTLNIHGCTGTDNRRDIQRVADCLHDLDFVALNEVHGPRLWERADQAEELGLRTGLAWLFAPNTRTWYTVDFGNGLLSALPVSSWQRIPLAQHNDRGFRNAVLVNLEHSGRTIRVLLTHITRHDDDSRHRQLRVVIDLYLSLAEPAILLGDLNSDADDPEIRRLLGSPRIADPLGEKLGPNVPPRIDWIFVRGLRSIDAGVRDDGASDHPMVWAKLEVK